MRSKVDVRVIRAIARRDLRLYFTNPAGYVFISLFVFLSAVAAFWQERFFLNNLANLDQLNSLFPFLLLFFIPALTMGVWSEERKLGTDEVLLTLPATDLEVVFGKYLAVLGFYTAALFLSMTHVGVLIYLGSPDLGLMFGNYVGYWLAGAALIAVGMFASQLTANATIAFILGAIFVGILVMVDTALGVFSSSLGILAQPLSVGRNFRDFADGVISLTGLLYFACIAGTFLYLNVQMLASRHWPGKDSGGARSAHHGIRAVAVIVALVSLNTMLARAHFRADVTAEKLHSLSAETKKLIKEIPEDRPVFIEAFVSKEVPEQFVQTRVDLLNLLHELDLLAGNRVHLVVHDTELYTEEARNARERFGITPRQMPNVSSARASVADVFMGVAFTCGAEEKVIPFFDRGLPAEYEIVRSIRVVTRSERKKVGVVSTGIRLFGGLDFETMRNSQPWSVIDELKKQYDVVSLNPSAPITEEVDALVLVLPSAMPQEEMDVVAELVQRGVPTLVLDDPLPIVELGLAPSERSGADRNPFMNQGRPPPKPKGDIEAFLSRFGFLWKKGQIVWDTYNPHGDLAHLPPEVVFVGEGNGNDSAFNREDPIGKTLQEVVFLYPGTVVSSGSEGFQATPLLATGSASGDHDYSEVVQRSFFGAQINPYLEHRPAGTTYTVAVRVKGKAPEASSADGAAEAPKGTDVIMIADVDFISEQFFQIRKMGQKNLDFDNVTFFLNCIDSLVGDDSFIELRNRRVKHRTLERVEAQTRSFTEQRMKEEEAAETDAKKALEDAQKRLNEKVEQVRQTSGLDDRAKMIAARNLQEVENRRFEVLKANIESEKDAKIQRSMENVEGQIRAIQSRIRTAAVLIPPIPVCILGIWIFVRRQRREREGAAAARRLRS